MAHGQTPYHQDHCCDTPHDFRFILHLKKKKKKKKQSVNFQDNGVNSRLSSTTGIILFTGIMSLYNYPLVVL